MTISYQFEYALKKQAEMIRDFLPPVFDIKEIQKPSVYDLMLSMAASAKVMLQVCTL